MEPPSPGSDASKQPEATKDKSVSRTKGPHHTQKLKSNSPKKDNSTADVEAGPSNARQFRLGPHRKENLNAITPSGYGSTKATRQANAGVSSNQANPSTNTTPQGGHTTVEFPHPPVLYLVAPSSQQTRASNMTHGAYNSPYRSNVQRRGRGSFGRGGPYGRGTMYRPTPYNRYAFQQGLRDANYWEDLRIRISNLRQEDCNTRAVHALLYDYGQVRHIHFEGHSAVVNLSFHRAALQEPILYRSISNETTLRIDVLGPKEEDLVGASTIPGKMLKKKTVIPGDGFQFGVLTGERSMMVMNTLQVTPDHPVLLALDLVDDHRKWLDLRFFISTTPGAPMYRIELRLDSPMSILEVHHENGHKDLIITSRDPPKWYRSVDRSELREAHIQNRGSINDWPRLWKRLTDIVLNVERNNSVPVSFVHPDPLIDTSRWLTWKLSFAFGNGQSDYEEIVEALKDHNVSVKDISHFTTTNRENAIIWKILDPHKAIHESDLHEMQDGMSYIRQELRYQLEVCISTGKINEFNMTKEFLRQLGSIDKEDALALLENVADSKRMIFNPIDIFSTNELHRSRKRTVPKGCVLMRTAVITPTTVYVKTPTVEVSNRVIRDNAVAESNFLRVKFQDEEIYGTLRYGQDYDNQDEVWSRIDRCLEFGIDIAGRHYAWLACGNSQFREHGAYFFAPYDRERTAPNIRANLGNFLKINEVARCMARIGQCFSTTRAFTNVGSVDVETIDDIERNGHCFSDGVGKISKFLAQMIASQFRIPTGPNHLPAAFQFRMGGCKGILALDPSLKGKTVQVRGSQTKFETPSGGLEIIRVSSFSTSTLNQQLILVLTALGVPKEIFLQKVSRELTQIDAAMTDEKIAVTMLTRNVDFNRVTLSIAEMVLDGFLKSDEPFVKSILELWRAWTLKFLKEKARITIEKGAFVFGCVDETNTLRMDEGQLPEIFIQIPNMEEKGKFRTIEGVCLLARNPSLHPGDIRVVKAVDCPSLEHLKNVVVLPQQGTRPLANMCSGGDLDGDDYLVIWDEGLLPPEQNWNHPAMDYTPPQSVKCDGPVQEKQFKKFFLDYIKYNNLGSIAVNHRAQADILAGAGGVGHPTCLELAQLHSKAVDFNKTGYPAKPNPSLRPRKYPHWIPGKPAHRTYHSEEVLGLLFDMVERVKFQPLLENPFDERILNAYEIEEEMLEAARVIKFDYDKAIRRIMSQHGIKTEFEVWTAFAMQHAREQAWYSFAEEMGLLMGIVKSEFQARVRKHVGLEPTGFAVSDEAFIKLGPFVAAMYKITAQEVARNARSKASEVEEMDHEVTFISFPWLFHKELGKIATKRSGPPLNKAILTILADEGVRFSKTKARYEVELRSLDIQPLPEWTIRTEGEAEAKSLVGDHVGILALQPGIDEQGGVESASISSVAEEIGLSLTSSRAISPDSLGWSETDASDGDEQSRSQGDNDKMAPEGEGEAKPKFSGTREKEGRGDEQEGLEEGDGSESEKTGESSTVKEGSSGKRSLLDQLADLMNS